VRRIPTLDGWRCIAILLVIGHHIATSYGNESALAWHGVIGVDVFFAISGLLITSQLLVDGHLGRFYIRRAFRILPPAVLYLAAAGLLGLASRPEILHCLLIVRNYIGAGTGFTAHFWSLSLEEQFYLVWPLLLLLSGKRGQAVALAGIAAVCVWRYYAWWYIGLSYMHTDQRCDGLLWGCVAAYCLREGKLKIGRLPAVAALTAGAFLWSVPLFFPLTPMLLAVGVLGTVQQPEWGFSRFLESKALVWVGQRSYGIYLWQQLFLFAPWRIPMVARLALVFLVPAILYRYFETPLRLWGRRLAQQVGKSNRPATGSLPLPHPGAVSHIIGVNK
jgi:peptidoglycan/LPS O-acetylase OafA/YrhL